MPAEANALAIAGVTPSSPAKPMESPPVGAARMIAAMTTTTLKIEWISVLPPCSRGIRLALHLS